MFHSLQTKINLTITVVLLLLFTVAFFIIDHLNEASLWQQKKKQAKVIYQQINYLKNYIGNHGGIWIKNSKDKNFIMQEGNFSRKNTSIVLAELSDAAVGNKEYKFRVVAPVPINPKSITNEFENRALMEFRVKGEDSEVFKIDKDKKEFYYVKPMITNSSCIPCHPTYKLGSVDGGISITLPADDIISQISLSRLYFFIFGILTVIILILVMISVVRGLVAVPIRELTEKAEKISTGDISLSADMDRKDEIGDLSKAIERLRISFKKIMNMK